MPKTMEFIPGYGYQWSDGTKVYQEQVVHATTGLPISGYDYGKPWAYNKSEVRVVSAEDGYWVMDRLSSFHRHPWKSADKAEKYAKYLRGEN